jgi:hypothetical protein
MLQHQNEPWPLIWFGAICDLGWKVDRWHVGSGVVECEWEIGVEMGEGWYIRGGDRREWRTCVRW